MNGTFSLRAAAVATVLFSATSFLPATGALGAPVTPECADFMTTAELQELLDASGTDPGTGEQIPVAGDGLTVVKGTMPQSFTARILDIDYGGAGIDHDLIFAELEGLGIDGARGIWYGMSGSPVYVGDKLIGAVAYGFSASATNLAGITPAEEMMAITSGAATTAETVTLSSAQRESYAEQMSLSAASVPSRVSRLRVPLALNVSAERLAWLQDQAAQDGSRLTPVAGGGFSAAATATPDISAGSNFAAGLSYGDITSAGTGTTTWTCDGEALAFGHPFAWTGKATLTMHNARAVAIVADQTFGSYKLATLGAPVGLVDEDRYTGLRGEIGTLPATTPIRSFTTVEHPGGDVSFDEGLSRVADGDNVPFVTFLHGFSNIDFLLDRYYSGGSSLLTWTVKVTHRGETYRLVRENRFNSSSDISIDSMLEPYAQLEQLAAEQFGKVRFNRVRLDVRAVDTQRYYRLAKLQTRSNGRWVERTRALAVDPGQTFRVRAVLHGFEGTRRIANKAEVFTITIPRRAARSFGEVFIAGGSAFSGGMDQDVFCFIEGECAGGSSGDTSFAALVRRLRRAPRNDEVLANVRLRGRGGFRWETSQERVEPRVVKGERGFELFVRDR